MLRITHKCRKDKSSININTMNITSCRQTAATICLHPLQVYNIFVFFH